jgi:hypothetical protein
VRVRAWLSSATPEQAIRKYRSEAVFKAKMDNLAASLRALGRAGEALPLGSAESALSTMRAFNVHGEMSVEEMIDRYGIESRPVRDLLVDYLREFLVSSDYSTVPGCPMRWQAVLAGPGASPPGHRLPAPVRRGRCGVLGAIQGVYVEAGWRR